MTLLTAINDILPYLGQRTVVDVDSNHPSVAKVKRFLNTERETLLSDAWWFNQRTATLSPDGSGLISYPISTLAIYPVGNTDLIEVRDGKLFNLSQNTGVFSGGVEVVLRDDLTFENLPHTGAALVKWRAAVAVYVSAFEGGSVPSLLIGKAQSAEAQFLSEHLRKMNYSTQRLPAVSRLHNILGGRRAR